MHRRLHIVGCHALALGTIVPAVVCGCSGEPPAGTTSAEPPPSHVDDGAGGSSADFLVADLKIRSALSVAIDGDTIAVGVYANEGEHGPHDGVIVGLNDQGCWQALTELEDSNDEGPLYESVAISGDTAIFGQSPEGDYASAYQHGARIFVGAGATWSEQQYLPGPEDVFGRQVGISGDTAIVSNPCDFLSDCYLDPSATNPVYVFVRSGTTWSQQAALLPAVPPPDVYGPNFGAALAIDGDTVAVSEAGATVGNAPYQGKVDVFVRNGESWIREAELTPDDGMAELFFGGGLQVSGDTLAVTSNESAYVYRRTGGAWAQEAEIPRPGKGYWGAVALSGDTLALDVASGSGQSLVHVFTRSGAAWSEGPSVAPGGTVGSRHTIALSGTKLAVVRGGSAVRVFDLSGASGCADSSTTTGGGAHPGGSSDTGGGCSASGRAPGSSPGAVALAALALAALRRRRGAR